MTNPAAQKYTSQYQTLFDALPTSGDSYFYNALWIAIKAIELAGTDTDLDAIAQAARSGNIEFESPPGLLHVTPDGESGLRSSMVLLKEGGGLEIVWPPTPK